MMTRKVCAMEDYSVCMEHGASFVVAGKPVARPDLAMSRRRFLNALWGGKIEVVEVDAREPAAPVEIKGGYGRSAVKVAGAVASVLAMMAHRGGEWV